MRVPACGIVGDGRRKEAMGIVLAGVLGELRAFGLRWTSASMKLMNASRRCTSDSMTSNGRSIAWDLAGVSATKACSGRPWPR